jgi:glutaredoxin 2
MIASDAINYNYYRKIRQGDMPTMKLRQLQYEVDSWKRVLRFITEENIHLKSRLSEAINDKFDRRLLTDAEEFQTRFIKKDELISLLRNETAELEKLFVREMFDNGIMINEIERKFKILRNNISFAEAGFIKMKSEFNNYLSGNVFNHEN